MTLPHHANDNDPDNDAARDPANVPANEPSLERGQPVTASRPLNDLDERPNHAITAGKSHPDMSGPTQPVSRLPLQGVPLLPGDVPKAPSRPIGRNTAGHRTPATYLRAAAHLTSRDQVVLTLLDEHRTLTTDQIAAILFDTPAAGRARLYRLRRAGWLDTFTPIRAGRALGTHWVLGAAGARWAAHHDGRRPPSLRELRDRNESLAASPHLAHTDGQNQFFIDLLAQARRPPADREATEPVAARPTRPVGPVRPAGLVGPTRLARWWSPVRTASAFGQRIRPDGHGVWEDACASPRADPRGEAGEGQGHWAPGHDRACCGSPTPRQVAFLLEYDTGTETLHRLLDKVEPYRRLWRDTSLSLPLLFVLPSPVREAHFHQRLVETGAGAGLTIATTNTDAMPARSHGPAGPVWRIAGNGRRRHTLAELPAAPLGPDGPHHPGSPTPDQDPLHLLRAQTSPR